MKRGPSSLVRVAALGCMALFSSSSSSSSSNGGGIYTEALPFTRSKRDKESSTENESSSSSAITSSSAAAIIHNGNEITISNVPNVDKSDRTSATVESFFSMVPAEGANGNGHDDDESDVSSSPQSQALVKEIKSRAAQEADFLKSTRRTLHQHPELMYQEEQTSLIVQQLLQQMNISYTTGWAKNTNPHVHDGPGGYGLVADIGTGQEPCVLLRADMDALPIFERTEGIDDFKSRNDNCMHGTYSTTVHACRLSTFCSLGSADLPSSFLVFDFSRIVFSLCFSSFSLWP